MASPKASVPNNLPRQLTSFIGRERDIEMARRLLSTTSLLTLTGVGGSGKTRLALRIALDLLDRYPDGVWIAATLDDLKTRNDGLVVLQRESEDGFVRYLLESVPGFIPEYVDIKRVNAGLLAPAEEDAATLELGKNVCALAQAYAASGGRR